MSTAYYRLPYKDHYTVIRSESDDYVLPSYEEIGKRPGFVVAPFINSARTPVVLIRPESVEEHPVPEAAAPDEAAACRHAEMTEGYRQAFTDFHDAITRGDFMKLVLSRTSERPLPGGSCESLFFEACRRYPRLMVMLVSTPVTGTWLVASPEILLTGDGQWWRTMALAGTMPFVEGYQEWNGKNRHEQRFVEAYIEDRLADFSMEIIKDGPRTQRAGNLVHLCTDFRFRLAKGCLIGEVLSSLHPTPAVCGIPKMKARDFIMANENVVREYYSGFMGPVGISSETCLYVSLRCARLLRDKAVLYAGGGIMPDSMMQSEWDETEHKMKTIGSLL